MSSWGGRSRQHLTQRFQFRTKHVVYRQVLRIKVVLHTLEDQCHHVRPFVLALSNRPNSFHMLGQSISETLCILLLRFLLLCGCGQSRKSDAMPHEELGDCTACQLNLQSAELRTKTRWSSTSVSVFLFHVSLAIWSVSHFLACEYEFEYESPAFVKLYCPHSSTRFGPVCVYMRCPHLLAA